MGITLCIRISICFSGFDRHRRIFSGWGRVRYIFFLLLVLWLSWYLATGESLSSTNLLHVLAWNWSKSRSLCRIKSECQWYFTSIPIRKLLSRPEYGRWRQQLLPRSFPSVRGKTLGTRLDLVMSSYSVFFDYYIKGIHLKCFYLFQN